MSENDNSEEKNQSENSRNLIRLFRGYTTIYKFTGFILVGVLFGIWLDQVRQSSPLYLIIIGTTGFVAGMVDLIKEMNRNQ